MRTEVIDSNIYPIKHLASNKTRKTVKIWIYYTLIVNAGDPINDKIKEILKIDSYELLF